MVNVSSSRAKLRRRASGMFGSRIARLILASNLAGLAILIAGAMVLNEMRAGLVVSKKQDLVGQAQIFTNLLGDGATIGQPEPALDVELARDTIRSLALPITVRAPLARTEPRCAVGRGSIGGSRRDILGLRAKSRRRRGAHPDL